MLKLLIKGLFSEKKLIEEIHNEFDSAPDRLLDKANSVINEVNSKEIELHNSLEDKAIRLERLGFTNNVLVDKIKEVKNKKMVDDSIVHIQSKEANLIKYYSQEYPFLKFLTISELDRICNKYGLVYAPVSNYKMPVPDKNLLELENTQILKTDDKPLRFYSISYNSYTNHHENYVHSRELKSWDNPLTIETELTLKSDSDIKMALTDKIVNKYKVKKKFDFANDFEINEYQRDGLFIAAPKNHFNLKGLKFDKKKGFFNVSLFTLKSDPIVFRYVKGGVQVLSKWGLEANDPDLTLGILN